MTISKAVHRPLNRGNSTQDQSLDLRVDGRATSCRPARELGPVLAKAAPLPSQDSVRSHDHEGLSPLGPDSGQPDPEEAIRRAQLGPCRGSLVHGELVAQGEVLEGELAVAAAEEGEETKHVEQEGDHGARILSGSEPTDQPLALGWKFWRGTGQIGAKGGSNAQHWVALAGLYYNLGGIFGFLVFGVLADTWGRKPTMMLYYVGALVLVLVLFRAVQDPSIFLVVAAANGFFTAGQFAWMPVYLPELFPTAVRGSAISLVFDVTRYVAAAGPLLAGWLIVNLGGVNAAASIIGLVYILGVIVTPFAAPETKGRPLPT